MSTIPNPAPERGSLPREHFEPVISRPIELDRILETEFLIRYFDLDGEHAFQTCCGDLIKTVNALMDYSLTLEKVCEEWHLEGFHRATYEYHANKLQEIAGKFQTAIGYDYAAAVEKCRKKREKPERSSDVGDDALTQAFRRSQRKASDSRQSQEMPDHTERLSDDSEELKDSDFSNDTDIPDAASSPWEDDEEP